MSQVILGQCILGVRGVYLWISVCPCQMFNSSHNTAKDKREIWAWEVCVLGSLGLSSVCVCKRVCLFVVSQRHLLNNESPVKSLTPGHVFLSGTIVIAVREN